MYFGSVKFFKHLMVLTVVLLITTLIIFTVVLVEQNNALKTELDKNNNAKTTADTNGNVSQNGLSPATTNDSYSNPATSDPSSTDPSNPNVDLNWPPKPEGAYSDLFPDMYAAENNAAKTEYSDYDERCVYLTFDDGPSANTSIILDYLAQHDVEATFFVVPYEGSANLLNKIKDAGHSIAIHTYTHVYSEVYKSVEAYLEDFYLARNLIHEQTGIYTDVFRFPGGSINDYNKSVREDIIAEMTRRGFIYYDWNVDSNDSQGASWEDMYEDVPRDIDANLEKGERSVVLFHDSSGNNRTTWAISDIIEALKESENKYTFKKIDTNTKPLQWPRS